MLRIFLGIVIAWAIIALGAFIGGITHALSLRDTALYIHLVSLAFCIGGIVYADHLGFSWMRGKVTTLHKTSLYRAHHAVGIGLGLMLGSGSVLFWNLHRYLLHQPLFYIKMSMVLALIINSFFIERFLEVATKLPFTSLTQKQKKPLFISGAVSLIGWAGAVVVAYLLFGWPF